MLLANADFGAPVSLKGSEQRSVAGVVNRLVKGVDAADRRRLKREQKECESVVKKCVKDIKTTVFNSVHFPTKVAEAARKKLRE